MRTIMQKVMFGILLLCGFVSQIKAQQSCMLWGYCDNPKRADSFTFVSNNNECITGIIFCAGFNMLSFSVDTDNRLLFHNKNTGATISLDAVNLQAKLSLGNGQKLNYKLASPPYALIQSLQNSANNSSTTQPSSSRKKECSLCHGRGWIAGTKAPNYGTGNYYCRECNREVPASHSHDICPSCGGR